MGTDDIAPGRMGLKVAARNVNLMTDGLTRFKSNHVTQFAVTGPALQPLIGFRISDLGFFTGYLHSVAQPGAPAPRAVCSNARFSELRRVWSCPA